tara:strand:+ start:1580 stop:3058 length:1479 start_codon:yes stop_codon:yes gene_type:complete
LNTTRKTTQTFIAHCLIIFQGILLIPLITKVSGAEVYGLYIILVSIFNFIFGISSFGYGYKAMRYLPSISNDPNKKSLLFIPQFYFQLVSVFLLSIICSSIMFYGLVNNLWLINGYWIPLTIILLLVHVVYSQGTIFFRYTNRIGALNLITSIYPVLFILLTLLTYFFTNTIVLNTLIVSSISAMGLISFFAYRPILKEVNFKPIIPNFLEFKQDIKLGLPLTLSYLVETIIAIGDRYLIAYFMTVKDVGMYHASYALGGIIIILAKVFGIILPPILSKKIDAGKTQECINLIKTVLRIYLIVSIPFIFGGIVLGEDLLHLMTTKDLANESWVVIPIISFGAVIFGVNMILSNVLFVEQKTVVIFKANSVAALLNIALNIFLLGIFRNIESAAISTIISHIVSFIIIKKNIDDKWTEALEIKFISYLLVISCLMMVFIILFNSLIEIENLLLGLSSGVLVGGLVYMSILFLSKKYISEEMNILKRAVNSLLN